MSLRETASRTTVFPSKRPWRLMLGSLLLALCAAGLLGYLVYEFAQIVIVWIKGPVGFWLVLEILLFLVSLALLVIFGTVALVGVVFFGGAFIQFWKDCLRPPSVVELLPEGIRGGTNIGDIIIPWSCIASVRLELLEKQETIGIETTEWPPYPLWKNCSGGVRRMLWQRHNRRQTPIYLFLHEVSASPEVILRAIEDELAFYRKLVSESK